MPARDPGALGCAIERSITVLGDRWSLLVLREAALGTTRFSEFRQRLGIAGDVLTDRLQALVHHGVLDRVEYREEGSRTRSEYRLTAAGREFGVVLGALGDWGSDHLPSEEDRGVRYRDARGRPVRVAFVDDDGAILGPEEVAATRP